MYEFLIFDLFLITFWFILYLIRKDLRKEMIFASFLAMPLGITQILFVPYYWKPATTLFNFTGRIGFDIESLSFCFAVGGIAAVLYEEVLKKHLRKARESRIQNKRHFYLLGGVLITSTILFSFIFKENWMYVGIVAMALGAVTIMFSRKDLIKEVILGGILFVIVYFIFLLIINALVFPNWIARTWNFDHLLGITIFKIPLEEILWALTFGSLWAPIYEDLKGYALK